MNPVATLFPAPVAQELVRLSEPAFDERGMWMPRTLAVASANAARIDHYVAQLKQVHPELFR